MLEEVVFQFGNRYSPRRKSFSSLEIVIPQGGSRFPVWKLLFPKEEVIFQFGNRYPPRRTSFSSLEIVILQGGSRFPVWKSLFPNKNSLNRCRVTNSLLVKRPFPFSFGKIPLKSWLMRFAGRKLS